MATASTKPKPRKYADETLYLVAVSRVAPAGRVKLRPKNQYRVKGRILNGIDSGVILSAVPIAATR